MKSDKFQRNMQSLLSGPTFLQLCFVTISKIKNVESYRKLSVSQVSFNKILDHIVDCFYLTVLPH